MRGDIVADPGKKNKNIILTMMRRKHQPLKQLPVMQTRSKKKNVQTKAVQNVIMECILKEVEVEKMKQIADGGN